MTVLRLSVDIGRPPADVFATLADLPGYARWLGRSPTYRETATISDHPIRAGTTYVDHIVGNRLIGTVLECEPDRRLAFHQATPDGGLAITITYELSPTDAGTHLVRTGSIETGGLLRLVHPVVVYATRAENRRMMGALKAYLEGSPGT